MSAPAPGVDGAGAADSPISRFLADSEEHIQDLLLTHRIPPEDTAELLHQALSMLVYRWGELSDPKAWLGAMLAAHCQRYWRRRGVTTSDPGVRGAAILDFEPPRRL